jgi:hypothetical protein
MGGLSATSTSWCVCGYPPVALLVSGVFKVVFSQWTTGFRPRVSTFGGDEQLAHSTVNPRTLVSALLLLLPWGSDYWASV